MRILLLTHEFLPFMGGIATYCSELALAATRLGHQVTVLAPDYQQDNRQADQLLPYRVERFRGGQYHVLQMLRMMSRISKLRRRDYDVIHAAEGSSVVAMAALQPVTRLPFIATVHGTDIFGFAASRLAHLLRAHRPLRRADRVYANSLFTAALARQHDPALTDSTVNVAHLGVNSWWFESATDTELLRRYGIDPHRKILLSVSRLDERKGHLEILQGLAALPQHYKDQLSYVIVGQRADASHYQRLRSCAATCGVPTIFTDGIPREDVRQFYKQSWLYSMLGVPHPNTVEGFGLVYLEAAAQGLPSLATPIGGVPEVVVDQQTGVLLKGTSASAVAHALQHLLDNSDIVAALGRRALQHAREFTWQRCAESTYADVSVS